MQGSHEVLAGGMQFDNPGVEEMHRPASYMVFFNSIELDYIPFNYTWLHFIEMNDIQLHFIQLNYASLHFNQFNYIDLLWITLDQITPDYTFNSITFN